MEFNTKDLILNNKYLGKFSNGYPLITSDVLERKYVEQKEGSIVNLLDKNNNFIAKGYVGKQNKGIGWVLSNIESEKIDFYFFKNKLEEAFSRRDIFFKSNKTNAFRVFNGEGDGIGGFTIDYFNGYYLVNWYSEGAFSFSDTVYSIIRNNENCKGIYQKRRYNTDGTFIDEDGFVSGTPGVFPLIVKENNVNIAIYLNEGAMTGVFLDQRDVRKRIRDKYALNKNVLNTFSYTGAFSIFAALGNSKKTTSVDLANRSLLKTEEQFRINNIEPKSQEIIVQDVFNYFKIARKQQKKFDLVILDPPSFAKSKKNTFSAQKNYTALLEDAISITENNGVIIASTNCSLFNMNTFIGFIDKAFKNTSKKYKILESHALPRDFQVCKSFKEGNYLKVCFIQIG